MKNKIVGLVLALSLFTPAVAFADSTVTASAGIGSSISPAGTTVVPTGLTQIFTVGALNGYRVTDVAVDGISQGALGSIGFTGVDLDTTVHTITSSAIQVGGAMPWCSDPMAPGWNTSFADGGCGGTKQYVRSGAPYTLNGQSLTCNFESGCMLP